MLWQSIGRWSVVAALALFRAAPLAVGVLCLETSQYALATLAFSYYIERLRDRYYA